MAKKSTDDGDRNSGRANYAPEWITKSIIRVPPSNRPLPPNPIVDNFMGVERQADGKGDSQKGSEQRPPSKDAHGDNSTE